MNWYKKAREFQRRLGDPFLPDEEQYRHLVGVPSDRDEIGIAPKGYHSYMNSPVRDEEVPGEVGSPLSLDLNSLISEMEDTIQEMREVKNNPNLSTRRRSIDRGVLMERKRTKDYLKIYIDSLQKELSFLKKIRRDGYNLPSGSLNMNDLFSRYYTINMNMQKIKEKLFKNLYR